MARAALLASVCLLLQAVPRPAALQGQVVRAGSSAPVAHARVVAAKVGGTQADYRSAVADAKGTFVFSGVTPGTYRIYATREGYLRGEFGRRGVGASGIPVVVAEGQSSADLEIIMTPTGAIAGRVMDRGRPVRNAWVRALKARYTNGERNLAVTEWTQTDDRGEYRLFDLPPGLYYVAAVPRERPRVEGSVVVTPVWPTTANGNQTATRAAVSLDSIQAAAFDDAVFPPVYHPGTTDASAAAPIDVRGGETTFGIELSIAPSRTFHVRGQAVAAGLEHSSLIVGMYAPDGGTLLRTPNAELAADGSFDFPRIPPGRYFLTAQTRMPPGPLMRDAIPIEVVDRDVEGLTIALRPGVTVTGRLTIEGRPPPPTGFVVQLAGGAGSSNYTALRYEADGTFKIENVLPRSYQFGMFLNPRTRMWVKSARFGDDDVLTGPVRITEDQRGRLLEIDVAEGAPVLDAIVLDAQRRPVPGVLVVAVPDEARRSDWRAYRNATTGADGRARLESLAPGEYTVFASESIEAADWQDPAVLQRHQGRGTTVQVRQGEAPAVTLRIGS